MENFKQIAEDCLAGKLSGTFVIDKGKNWHSSYLQRHTVLGREMPGQYVLGPGIIYNEIGQCEGRERLRIIDFIPDNMQKKIKIDIPEGKVPVMEQTENGVVITWKEEELTYKDIENKIILKNARDCIIGYTPVIEDIKTLNCPHSDFYKKVEVLRKLINIRNYFGLDPHRVSDWVICISTDGTYYARATRQPLCYEIAFSKQEHAEQAIKMLGDELKYLFEPW
jgi:hypothetical protein